MTKKLLVVMYHHVRKKSEKFFPKLNSLDFNTFKKQLDYLEKNYEIINYKNLVNFFHKKKKFKKNICILTFDDGYLNHYTNVFPELKKRNLQGFFFPPAKAIVERKLMDSNKIHLILASNVSINMLNNELEKLFNKLNLQKKIQKSYKNLEKEYKKPFGFDNADTIFFKRMMQHIIPEYSRERIISHFLKKFVKKGEKYLADNLYFKLSQAKEMISNGMYFGNHCYNHLWLDKNNIKVQNTEIKKGIDFLKRINGYDNKWLMCYPYGSYNLQTLQILKKKNCFLAFTTVNKPYFKKEKNFLEIPRIDCNNVFEH